MLTLEAILKTVKAVMRDIDARLLTESKVVDGKTEVPTQVYENHHGIRVGTVPYPDKELDILPGDEFELYVMRGGTLMGALKRTRQLGGETIIHRAYVPLDHDEWLAHISIERTWSAILSILSEKEDATLRKLKAIRMVGEALSDLKEQRGVLQQRSPDRGVVRAGEPARHGGAATRRR